MSADNNKRAAALTRAIHRAAYLGIDHVDKDDDTAEVGYLDAKGRLVDLDGETWRIVVEKVK